MDKRLSVPSDDIRATLDARMFDEPAPSARTEAQRDRDRILYSSALLRLGHVTQVAAPEIGHSFHSRLSHSLKVAQVARGLAQRLKTLSARDELDPRAAQLVAALDEDAAEAAALAHDLGHPPFGHLAERVLQEMPRFATFEGNPQSFRIVTRLALRTVDIPGLNLTRRTLNGLLKYPWLRNDEDPASEKKWGAYASEASYFEWAREGLAPRMRTLEAELMDWADDVTYAVHDMEDFYRAGLIPMERLAREPTELAAFQEHLRRRHPRDGARLAEAAGRLFDGYPALIATRFAGRREERISLRLVTSWLIGHYIESLELKDDGDGVVLRLPDAVIDEVTVLKELTWFYIILRPSLAVIQQGQSKIVATLYDVYREAVTGDDVSVLPLGSIEQLETAKTEAAKERVIIDLIASMTESGATETYRQLMGVASGSLMQRVAGPT